MAQELTPQQPEAAPLSWERVHGLPCVLSVELSIPAFTVSDLIQLQNTMVINTKWPISSEVPVLVNGKLIGWSEFEVVSKQLAVRLTQLA